MTTTVAFPLANYPNGTQTSSAVAVDDAATMLTFSIQRCTTATPTIWPNSSTTLSINVEQSNDGGSTWQPNCSFTSAGGIVSVKGVEQSTSYLQTNLFPGTNRKLRATATIAGGPLRSSGQFDIV